jgi:GT2 family glycosyltransferase
MAETAIVILNWNGIGHLKNFLGKVVELSDYQGTTIYMADNGSTDDSVQWVIENHPAVNIIRLDRNWGFAGGYNLALQEISAKYFILLNSDIEVTPGWLAPLVGFMEKNPETAACQPKILSWHKRNEFEYAGAAGGFLDKYGYPFCRGRIFNHVEEDHRQYDKDINIFWSSGACMIIRRDAWINCSGFDADFFAHMEEIDLCWRFHRAGYKVAYTCSSVVYHVGGGVLTYGSPLKTYLNFRNNLFLLYKNLPEKSFRRVMFTRRLLDGISAAMFLVTGKPALVKAIWNAHMDYYRAIPSLKLKRLQQKLPEIKVSETILNKSIVFEFYLKRKKTFNKLKMNISYYEQK